MAVETNIFLVRHGETEWNKLHRLQGNQNSPLTSKGTRQAHEVKKLIQQFKINKAYVSPLKRARDTIDIILKDSKLAAVVLNDLREINLGPWEGKTQDETELNNYRKDKYYPRVVRAVAKILSKSDVVAPVDVLIEMENLSEKNHDAWRRGKVPYLERVFEGNLSKANRILRIIGFHAHDLNLVTRNIHYHQWGKGKKHALQFSKSGDRNVEQEYSRHYLWNQSPEKKQKNIEQVKPEKAI